MIKRINVIRRIGLVLVWGLVFGEGYSQIIITQNDLPVAGETWIEHNDPSTTVNLTQASSSPQTWDYSASFSSANTKIYNYLPPSQVFGFSYFPNSDLGITTVSSGGADTSGVFFENTSSGLYVQGFYDVYSGTSSTLSYDSNSLEIPVPFTYGSSRLATARTVQNSSIPGFFNVITISTTVSYFICDAYGTMKTPANPVTPVDVIRIKSRRLSQTDSTFYDTVGIGNFYLDTVINYGPSIGISYQFYQQKNSCISKVMTIEYDSVSQYVDYSRYYECSFTGISEYDRANSKSLNIFPNPTTGTIQLTFNTKHNAPLMCEIINVMGERVFQKEIKQTDPDMHRDDVQLDVSFLAKGIYVVRVGDGGWWENKKLVVE